MNSKSILKIISGVLALSVLISMFVEVPYYSHAFYRFIVLCCIAVCNFISVRRGEASLKNNSILWKQFHGLDVYLTEYKVLQMHNVLLVKDRKEQFIVVERQVQEQLTQTELQAVLLHEEGHMHTISSGVVSGTNYVAAFILGEGMHSMLYHEPKYIFVVSGICLVVLLELLKRYIENQADYFAVSNGANITELISAINKIDNMNCIDTKIIVSGHPKLKSREKYLRRKMQVQ